MCAVCGLLRLRTFKVHTIAIPEESQEVPNQAQASCRQPDLKARKASAIPKPSLLQLQSKPHQVKLLLPKFHRNRTRKYYNIALFVGGC